MPALDINSTASSGARIVKFIVYDNDKDVFEGADGQTGVTLYDANIRNGFHHVVVNAWDSAGRLFQAEVTFNVIGEGFQPFCPAPATPGINFCVPPGDAILGLRYAVSASATGNSSIAAIRLYVDGKAQQTEYNRNYLSTGTAVGMQGNHTIAFVAWDTTGHVFNNTRTIKSSYTYGSYGCPPRGNDPCTPGFLADTIAPQSDSYIGNSFTINAEIRDNPRPITAMRAYVDNTAVAASTGPTMHMPIENAPNGTHIFTLQAWDTVGVLYRIQYNININVAH